MKLYLCGAEYGESLNMIDASSSCEETLTVKFVACGFDHVMLVTLDNEIYSIGLNHHGQLAIGDSTVPSNYKTLQKVLSYPFKNQNVKLLACGYSHNVLVTDSDEIWVSGGNQFGVLGLGHASHSNKFTKVAQFTQNAFKLLSCGGYHTVLVTENNEIWTCGHNNRGQLGHGDTVDRNLFKRVDTQGSFRDLIFGVGSLHGKAIKHVACGGSHTVVLTVDYGIWACGSNRYGQLGLGYSKFYFNSLVFQQIHSSIPRELKSKTVKSVACGVEHTYLVTESGLVFSVGMNTYGQLGQQCNKDSDTFQAMISPELIESLAVSSPSQSTLMLSKTGELFGCGYNGSGQIGLKDKKSRTKLTKIPIEDISGDEEIIAIAHGAKQSAVVVATKAEIRKRTQIPTANNTNTEGYQIPNLQQQCDDEDDKQAILQELKQQEQTNIRLKQWNNQLLAVLKQNLRQWKIPPSQIELLSRINEGAYGRVYKGVLRKDEREEIDVAVKEFYLEVVDWNAGIATEIGILANLKHDNCVKFYGFSEDTDKIQIITELMETNLDHLLHNSEVELDDKLKLHIALEVAKGIQYLHSQDPIVLHMDIKSENILVNNDGEIVKISDFGLSELTSCSLVEIGALGTAEYIAPEAIRGTRSCQCDVYSFGVLLYEIWFRKRPFAELNLMKHELMHQVLTNHIRPQIPTTDLRITKVTNLMQVCWSPNPSQRPSFTKIVSLLQSVIQSL